MKIKSNKAEKPQILLNATGMYLLYWGVMIIKIKLAIKNMVLIVGLKGIKKIKPASKNWVSKIRFSSDKVKFTIDLMAEYARHYTQAGLTMPGGLDNPLSMILAIEMQFSVLDS